MQFVRKIQKLLANKVAGEKLTEFDVRHNYVLELLRQLGWNVENKGLSPFEFEVLCETSIRSGRPDITLRLHGSSVFYVETKSLKRVLTYEDVLQVWRYAWSSGHPFSLLTNFLDSWLIDCRSTPPCKSSEVNSQRQVVMRWHASNLEKQWADIYSILGRASVADGSLTELEESISQRAPKVRGIELTLFPLQGSFPVDRYFLGQLGDWRLRLVKNIHASQTKWSSDQVVEVADQLLNLIVFTRILEDQGLEPDFPLKKAL